MTRGVDRVLRGAVAVGILAASLHSVALAAGKPAVPAGRDPGGVAVAFVGPGIDYTDRGIADRLARDGEGEIVGFDVMAADRQPYAAGGAGNGAAKVLLAQAGGVRLAVFMADGGEAAGLARAAAMALSSPARVIVLFSSAIPALGPPGLAALAARLGGRLLVIAWDMPGEQAEDFSAADGVVRVCVAAGACGPAQGDAPLLVSGDNIEAALAHAAARAANAWSAEPSLAASEIKRRLLAAKQ